MIIRSTSGDAELVLVERTTAGYPRIAWSPDSRFVIFNNNPDGLHRVSIDGGPPQLLGIRGIGGITEKSMNPDGRRLALSVGRTHQRLLVWTNVLAGGRTGRE